MFHLPALRRSHAAPRPRTDAEAAAAARRAALIPLAGAQFLASYDTSSMNVAISNIVEDLGTTVTGVQTALSLFTLTMAALMIPGSKLTDIWGRKRCFTLGVSIYAVGAGITALAPALGAMILGFSFLEGVGSALMIPPIYILITVMVTDMKERAKAFAIVSAMAGLGSAMGPLLGGLITTTITWRASFALEVVALLFILRLSKNIPDPPLTGPRPAFDLLGTVLSAAGLIFIVFGLLQAGNYGWLKARKDFVINDNVLLEQGQLSPVVFFIAIGLVLLGLFGLSILRKERRGKEPLLPSRLFKSRESVLGLVTQNSQWFIMIGTFFTISVFLQVSKGLNAIETGLTLTPATAGILLSSARVEPMVARFSQRTIIRGGFILTLTGVLLVILLAGADKSVLYLAPGLFIIGFGAGIMLTASVNVVQSSAPEADQGSLSGLSRSVSNLGSSLGTAVAGAVLISALIGGVTDLTNQSTVLDDAQKQQISVALQGNVTALSDEQIQEQLQGQPQETVDEVTRINAEARDRALGLSLAAIAVIGLIGLTAAMFLPANAGKSAADAAAP